ncbi:hypothetical protein [Halalkalibacter flavus]|uniref:hypothetical protein n=1 Tax=Halalkalibacter flavus TaxID=3090668 RepID=UPI002FC64A86
MLQTIEIILQCLLAFVMLISIAHLLGKQTISQITYHDFIATIMLGAIAGNLTFNVTISMKYIIVALISFVSKEHGNTVWILMSFNMGSLINSTNIIIKTDIYL